MNPILSRGTLALLVVLGGCGRADADQRLEEFKAQLPDVSAARVEVVQMKSSDATLRLDLPGEVVGHQDALLGAAAGGFVESLKVHLGDEVKKGQTLALIDHATRRAQVAQGEAQLAQAADDLRRAKALGDLSSEARLGSLETAVKMAEANLQLAQVAASRAVIRAPFDGVVGSLSIEEGEIAPPSTPVMRLVALDPVKVVMSVSDRDIVALREGMTAVVSTAASGTFTNGTVTHVGPVADLSTRSFLAEVQIPNADRKLLPGMIARVQVDREIAKDAVVVPQDWLVTRVDGYGAYVVEDGIARWRDIELGELVRGQVVVTDGLSVGDRLVITGQQLLADGDPVLIAREGTCCEDGRPVF